MSRRYSAQRTSIALSAAFVACVTAAALAAQTLNPSPRAVIGLSRSLVQAEVAQVLAAARAAMAGRTLRMSYQPGGPGPELLMDADGRPHVVRAVSGYTSWSGWASNGSTGTREQHVDVTEVTEFTRREAQRCDGSAAGGELVVEYRNENEKGWTAKARVRTAREFASTIFDMLTGAAVVESGARQSIENRDARAFVAPWTLPPGAMAGGPLPAGVTQTLWIDVESLLPLRWDLGPRDRAAYRLLFNYEALDIRPPDGVAAPQCIS
jgi:hypothetical protein